MEDKGSLASELQQSTAEKENVEAVMKPVLNLNNSANQGDSIEMNLIDNDDWKVVKIRGEISGILKRRTGLN